MTIGVLRPRVSYTEKSDTDLGKYVKEKSDTDLVEKSDTDRVKKEHSKALKEYSGHGGSKYMVSGQYI